jgi:hypothetical protein
VTARARRRLRFPSSATGRAVVPLPIQRTPHDEHERPGANRRRVSKSSCWSRRLTARFGRNGRGLCSGLSLTAPRVLLPEKLTCNVLPIPSANAKHIGMNHAENSGPKASDADACSDGVEHMPQAIHPPLRCCHLISERNPCDRGKHRAGSGQTFLGLARPARCHPAIRAADRTGAAHVDWQLRPGFLAGSPGSRPPGGRWRTRGPGRVVQAGQFDDDAGRRGSRGRRASCGAGPACPYFLPDIS